MNERVTTRRTGESLSTSRAFVPPCNLPPGEVGDSRTSTRIPAGRNPSRPFRNQVVIEDRSVGLSAYSPAILFIAVRAMKQEQGHSQRTTNFQEVARIAADFRCRRSRGEHAFGARYMDACTIIGR